MPAKIIVQSPPPPPQTDLDLWTIAALERAVAEIGANGYTHQVVARPVIAPAVTVTHPAGRWIDWRRGNG
jgi:hypothetical protein